MANARLRNRNESIPNGLTFFLPQTGWRPREHSSFKGIADALFYHLKANPHVAASLGWPVDQAFLADKVDEYNAEICLRMGWNEFITTGGGQSARPFPGFAQAPVPAQPVAGSCCGGAVHR
jgi:hypothetical protein